MLRSISPAPVVLVVLICLSAPAPLLAQDASSAESTTRSLVHVLDYMAADYAVAVQNGVVVNEAEYAEMVSFVGSARLLLDDVTQTGALADAGAFVARMDSLGRLVDGKADPDIVASTARGIRSDLISATGLLGAPASWPDLAAGERIYVRYCTQCHGTTGGGDGAIAADLDPAPTVFNGGDRIASISPFQAYNTIRLGVDGTSMPGFGTLTDQETWDIAFYVKSLASRDVEGAVDVASLPVTLDDVAMHNDLELRDLLSQAGVSDADGAVHALRTHVPASSGSASLGRAVSLLDEAVLAYRSGDVATARQHALRAYLEGIEPVEPAIGARDRTFLVELESRMMDVRSAIEGGADAADVEASVARAQGTIAAAGRMLDADRGSVWFSFFVAASILLREGLEAFLIILAILSVLKAAGQDRASHWVHGGWMAAFGVGVLGWFFSDRLMTFGAAQREIMEGGIALLAVAVLLYVGLWLHSMTESKKWRAFIEDRIMQKLGTGSLIGLASIAFFAVFREAFESVLFLSALSLEQGGGHKVAVVGGALSAIALILVLAPVALRRSVRLPIRQLFRYSSFVMGFLCIVLAGKGIHALQEAGVISVSVLRTSLRFDLLGVYPSMETMMAQLAIVLVLTAALLAPRLRSQAV